MIKTQTFPRETATSVPSEWRQKIGRFGLPLGAALTAIWFLAADVVLAFGKSSEMQMGGAQ